MLYYRRTGKTEIVTIIAQRISEHTRLFIAYCVQYNTNNKKETNYGFIFNLIRNP